MILTCTRCKRKTYNFWCTLTIEVDVVLCADCQCSMFQKLAQGGYIPIGILELHIAGEPIPSITEGSVQ